MGRINGKTIIKHVLFAGLFPWYYRHCAGRRRPEGNLFLEIRYPSLTEDLRLLYETLKEESPSGTELFFLETGRLSGPAYILRCLKCIRAVAAAECVFVDESSNLLAALPVRKETRIIQCWHACGAFKRFGHGLPEGLEEAYYGLYSLVTVSSEEVVDIYRDSMRQPEGVVKATGVSRTDRFFDRGFLQAARERVRARVPETEGKRVILYAPTFRGNVARAEMPRVLDIRLLKESLPPDCVILYRGHPAVKERVPVPEDCRSFFFDVTDVLGTEDCMCRADVCVTDYSSLVFEFALLKKPMVFYVYDLDSYDTDRGFYYPFRQFAPGPVCLSPGEAVQALRGILEHPEEASDRLEDFRRRFMGACDGHATERILAEIKRQKGRVRAADEIR